MFANLAVRKGNNGVLAHLVERNTGSVEVSGSSPLCSTQLGTYSNASAQGYVLIFLPRRGLGVIKTDQQIFTVGIDKIYRSTASARLIYG